MKKYTILISFCTAASISSISLLIQSCGSPGKKLTGAEVVHERRDDSFEIPPGWVTVSNEGGALLKLGQSKDGIDPRITINTYNEFDDRYSKDEDGCARSYKEGIASIKDESIKMETVGSVRTIKYGEVNIYRLHSGYYGDNLVSFIVREKRFVTLELWVPNAIQRSSFEHAFQLVLKSMNY